MKLFRNIPVPFVVLLLLIPGCSDSEDTSTSGSNAVEPSAEDMAGAAAATSDDDASDAAGQESDAATPSDSDTEAPETEASEKEAGEEQVLKIGSPAPPIHAANFVKGEAVSEFTKDQVYVVEFWATWCGPCIQSMPHMAGLQTEYGDKVTFIGVSNEDESTVRNFLQKEQSEGKTWDDVITYRMALDNEEGQINQNYMRAAKQRGIPTAFIVGADSRIEWIGHPMTMDEPLQQIVDGSYDREAAVKAFEAQRQAEAVQMKVRQFFNSGEFDKAVAAIDEALELTPDSASLLLMKAQALGAAGKNDESAKAFDAAVDKTWEDSRMLNAIAWQLATAIPDADMAVALKAALRASELTKNEDGSIMDTVARVYYEQGNFKEALAWQQKAVAALPDNAELKASLARYEEAAGKKDAPPAEEKKADAPEESEKPAAAAEEKKEAPAAEEKAAEEKPAEEKAADDEAAAEEAPEAAPAEESADEKAEE
ncbi:MAG: redoxin domain-containing protein [Fuerstiella sp.]